MITSKDIQMFILKHWLEQHHCPYVCSNFSGLGFAEADAIAISKAGIITEFEIKMSRADFFADFRKPKHEVFKSGMKVLEGNLHGLINKYPNKFYFAVPKNLVSIDEVPEYAGLIYLNKYSLQTHPGQTFIDFQFVRKAPYIHKMKAEDELIKSIARTLSARFVYGCSLMTYKNRQIQERQKRN